MHSSSLLSSNESLALVVYYQCCTSYLAAFNNDTIASEMVSKREVHSREHEFHGAYLLPVTCLAPLNVSLVARLILDRHCFTASIHNVLEN